MQSLQTVDPKIGNLSPSVSTLIDEAFNHKFIIFSLSSICRYFLHGQVCPQGSKCTFSHMIPAPSLISPFQQALTLTAANLDLAASSKPNTGLEIGKTDSGYLSNESSQQFFPPVRPPTRSPSIEIARPNSEYEKFYNRMLVRLFACCYTSIPLHFSRDLLAG